MAVTDDRQQLAGSAEGGKAIHDLPIELAPLAFGQN